MEAELHIIYCFHIQRIINCTYAAEFENNIFLFPQLVGICRSRNVSFVYNDCQDEGVAGSRDPVSLPYKALTSLYTSNTCFKSVNNRF